MPLGFHGFLKGSEFTEFSHLSLSAQSKRNLKCKILLSSFYRQRMDSATYLPIIRLLYAFTTCGKGVQSSTLKHCETLLSSYFTKKNNHTFLSLTPVWRRKKIKWKVEIAFGHSSRFKWISFNSLQRIAFYRRTEQLMERKAKKPLWSIPTSIRKKIRNGCRSACELSLYIIAFNLHKRILIFVGETNCWKKPTERKCNKKRETRNFALLDDNLQ